MHHNDTQKEQLRQELLAQDTSLADHKKEYFGLFDRMISDIPEIEQDPMFFGTLKNKLKYHLVTKYQPAPTPNVWQKFLLYGFPTLAIGLAIIYVMPFTSFDQKLNGSDIGIISGAPYPENISQNDTQEISKSIIVSGDNSNSQKKPLQQEKNIPTSSLHDKTSEKVNTFSSSDISTSSEQDSSDTSLQGSEATSINQSDPNYKNINSLDMSENKRQTYHDDIIALEYIVATDQNQERKIDGIISTTCKNSFIVTQAIRDEILENLRKVTVNSTHGAENSSYTLLFTIENDTIIHVSGGTQLCQK